MQSLALWSNLNTSRTRQDPCFYWKNYLNEFDERKSGHGCQYNYKFFPIYVMKFGITRLFQRRRQTLKIFVFFEPALGKCWLFSGETALMIGTIIFMKKLFLYEVNIFTMSMLLLTLHKPLSSRLRIFPMQDLTLSSSYKNLWWVCGRSSI